MPCWGLDKSDRVGEVALLAAALPTLSRGIPSRHEGNSGSGRPERPENKRRLRYGFDARSMRSPIRMPQNVKLAFPLATFCGPMLSVSGVKLPVCGFSRSGSGNAMEGRGSHRIRVAAKDKKTLNRSEFSTRWVGRRRAMTLVRDLNEQLTPDPSRLVQARSRKQRGLNHRTGTPTADRLRCSRGPLPLRGRRGAF